MGNCCAAKAPSAFSINSKVPQPLKRPGLDDNFAEKEKDPRELKRLARIDEIGIFKTQSFIERRHKKKVSEHPELLKEIKTDLPEASKALLREYEPLDVDLGSGTFSNVFLFNSRSHPVTRYAVKIMFKEDLTAEVAELVNEEVQILAGLDHPNVVRYKESYEDENNLFIVMEYLEQSQDLQEMIDK